MMGTFARQLASEPAGKHQLTEVRSNSQLEPNSLNLALSTRGTEHESGTCASRFAPHCLVNDSTEHTSASRYLTGSVVCCSTRTPSRLAQAPTWPCQSTGTRSTPSKSRVSMTRAPLAVHARSLAPGNRSTRRARGAPQLSFALGQ
jgi:hypothetical protein